MRVSLFLFGSLLALTGAARGAEPAPQHGLAMHGDLKYGPDFAHFDYVDPNAPRGGEVRLAALGTAFDSFNPFVVKGDAADGILRIYDTLLESSADEPFSEYGLVAESVTVPPDRSWVIFRLRPEARFHDGKAMTADDVLFSFESLRDKGQPFYRAYYGSVASAERLDERSVKFTFKPGENRELPLILGQIPVLPKHFYGPDRPFERATLDIPLGSGPYRIDSFEAGRRVSYRRVENYWGRDLAINRGRYNFDVIHHEYFRDDTVAIEAFKGGAFDLRVENSAKHWATGYDLPAVREGMLRKEEIENDRPSGMQGFVFNTRRALFADRRVRAALAYAFDFEWSNKTLFYDQYRRSRSFFENSELAATGLPDAGELALLEPFRSQLPPEVFTTAYHPPATDGSGNLRDNLRRAVELLEQAGWKIDKQTRRLTHTGDGTVMRFEILLVVPLFERVVLPFKQNLERLGIGVEVRTVDSAQYERRIEDFDFDMVVGGFPQSLSPGNEQRSYWGSKFATQPGSQNLIGIQDPVVDALIDRVIAAPDRKSLVTASRALDRVLQWGHWVIPHWHVPFDRVLSWDKLGRPAVTPAMGFRFDAWWIDPERAKRLEAWRSGGRQKKP
jgi:microcin C transport system substrate-binding protein